MPTFKSALFRKLAAFFTPFFDRLASYSHASLSEETSYPYSWNSALAPWPEAYAEMRVAEYRSARH